MSTVADMPNTKKKRRVFPAISLKEVMIFDTFFEYGTLLLCSDFGVCNVN